MVTGRLRTSRLPVSNPLRGLDGMNFQSEVNNAFRSNTNLGQGSGYGNGPDGYGGNPLDPSNPVLQGQI